MTTIADRIAETQQEINEALKAAGLQNGHGVTVRVREQQTDWGVRVEGNGKLTATAEPSSLVNCRAKTFPERKDGAVNVAGIVEFARVVSAEYDVRAAAKDDLIQRRDAHKAALAATPHPGLSATADAAGIDLLHLTAAQFAAAVAALMCPMDPKAGACVNAQTCGKPETRVCDKYQPQEAK